MGGFASCLFSVHSIAQTALAIDMSKHLHSGSKIFFFDRLADLPEQGCAISDTWHTENTLSHDILINRLRQQNLDEIIIS